MAELPITRALIREFLNDSLPAERMAMVERAARSDAKVNQMIAEEREVMSRGDHSLGAIWQEHQISCPTREQLGGFLIEVGETDFLDYVRFHLETIECTICQANLDHLKQQAAAQKAKNAATGKPKRRR